MNLWLGEINKRLGIALKVDTHRILYDGSSKYFERIIIGESKAFGRFMVLKEGEDYTFQIAEKWDFYSEMLVHVPLCAHPKPERVLIIGGGDGSTLREVMKHRSVKEVIMVDIDEKIVDIGRNLLKIDKGAFRDPRLKIIINDAFSFVQKYEGPAFDVIIGDYTDPYEDTPASVLIKDEFYDGLKRIISPDGILSMQSGSPIFQYDILSTVFKKIKARFQRTLIYISPVPFYPGGIWSYVIASDSIDPSYPRRESPDTIFYNHQIHISAFKLPNFLKALDDTK